MRLRDNIKPLAHHVWGIPVPIRNMLQKLKVTPLKHLKGQRGRARLDMALRLYETMLKRIEKFEEEGDRHCPAERVEKAAEVLAHMIVDTAYIHDCISGTGYQIGDYPYGYLADKLIPGKEEVKDTKIIL